MVTRPHPRSQCEPESLCIANCPTLEDTDPAGVRERPATGFASTPSNGLTQQRCGIASAVEVEIEVSRERRRGQCLPDGSGKKRYLQFVDDPEQPEAFKFSGTETLFAILPEGIDDRLDPGAEQVHAGVVTRHADGEVRSQKFGHEVR